MRLTKIILTNIRSYTHQEIKFPKGCVLLWGDIGSGKSSILLGIDFALFGLQRGVLDGAALLRNGTDFGSVALYFTINDEDICITRTLQRSKKSIVQDNGYVIKSGIKEEKTALELKQFILDLFHYPQELLTKNRSLIYHYTVYVPQEEMKSILLANPEERLDVLRKVFGVDKYKRIKENTKVLVVYLRERKRWYEGQVADFYERMKEKEQKDSERMHLQAKNKELAEQLYILEEDLNATQKAYQSLEDERQRLEQTQKDLAICELNFHHAKEEIERNTKLILQLREDILQLEKDKPMIRYGAAEEIKNIERLLSEKENLLREVLNKLQEYRIRKTHVLHIKEKIQNLNTCPTCLQVVQQNHKDQITRNSDEELVSYTSEIEHLEPQSKAIEEEILTLRSSRETWKDEERKITILSRVILEENRKRQEVSATEEIIKKSEQTVLELTQKISLLHTTIKPLEKTVEKIIDLRSTLEDKQKRIQQTVIEKTRIETMTETSEKEIAKLTKILEEKRTLFAKKEQYNKLIFWLSENFIPLVENIEKNVLYTVHAEFNSLFEKWFSILMDTQTLYVTIDETYSPKILQNGYDIAYEHLSGGEKTAIALTYRIALNQVITNLNSEITTKDLLILDEPTDGFSDEQLDKLKGLLETLKIPQTIIVSHEQKMESFVDYVIRLEKTNHETLVM